MVKLNLLASHERQSQEAYHFLSQPNGTSDNILSQIDSRESSTKYINTLPDLNVTTCCEKKQCCMKIVKRIMCTNSLPMHAYKY
jgi:hypothetical protein